MSHEHHVIVGASAAGVAAALAHRASGFEGRISLVDAGGELPYERPPLSKAGDAIEDPRAIVPRAAYDDLRIDLVLGTEVRDLDGDGPVVALADGRRLHADAVLLATGVRPRTLEVPGADLEGVSALRDLADARVFTKALRGGGPLVLVGGGFIGLEAAAVARRHGVEVTVVEQADLPLARPLGPELAGTINAVHRDHGVRFRTGRSVRALQGGARVERVVLDDGSTLEAAAVLVGIGVVPADDLARRAGAYCRDGVVADGKGRTSLPWLWAAGDVASFVSTWTGARQRIEHWDVAQRRGTIAGCAMVGTPPPEEDVPYFWSDQYSHHIQMYGRARPGDRFVRRGGDGASSQLGFWVREGRLVAAAGIDAPKDLRAAKALIAQRARVDVDDLLNPAVSLRRLASARPASTVAAGGAATDRDHQAQDVLAVEGVA